MKLAQLAREVIEHLGESKVNKYTKDGLEQVDAERKADKKLREEDMNQLTSKYASLLQYLLQFQSGKIHSKVLTLLEELINEGINYKKAIKIAIRKYKHYLESYLDDVIEVEEDESGDEEEEQKSEDDDDGEEEDE